MEQTRVNLIAMAVPAPPAEGVSAMRPRLPVPGDAIEIVTGLIIGPARALGPVHPSLTLNFLAQFGLGMLFSDGGI